MFRAPQLRSKLNESGILVLPGVYDCLSARLAEQAGFPALFTSGFGLSAALLGGPDYGLLTATEVLTASENLARSVTVPIVADLDTGYGGPLNVFRTVESAAAANIAGIILEDQVWPKRCGHFGGKRVIPMEKHCEKIRAAVEARGDSDMIIIGRTDARAVEGLEKAIARGRKYFETGADVIFVEAPESLEELKQIPAALDGIPTFANMIEGGRTPLLPADELEGMGFKIVVYPLTGLFAATSAMREAFAYLHSQGTTRGLSTPVDFPEFKKVIGLPRWEELEKKFS
jgi:methylisocitrate lyase